MDYEAIKDYIGDHPSLAEACSPRRFRQLLWDVVGCEVSIGDWQQFTSEEQRLILYASFYGIPAPERVPYQKGTGLYLQGYEVHVTEVRYEYHSQYLEENSFSATGEDVEIEQVTPPPPPPSTEPELDDPIVFDPKVTGIWDHLLALMIDDQKAQLREQAKKEGASPSYRHVGSSEQKDNPSAARTEESGTSTSDTPHSRGPSRSHPVYLGHIAIAAQKANTFTDFNSVMNVIVPCNAQEAGALFTTPQWVARLVECTTHEDVMTVFSLFHSFCWSERDNCPTDPVIKTKRGQKRYARILRRVQFIEEYTAQFQQYPIDYGEDNFTSAEEEIYLNQKTLPRKKPPVPGDFVLTFNVLALANTFESQFPHRSEYWWTQLPGNIDQACTCFSMKAWLDQLASCTSEESFLTTYQSFLDTTWQALQGLQ